MKRVIALAALMAAGLVAGPATAQYYGPGYDRPPPPPGYGYGPPPRGPRYDDEYDRPPRGYRPPPRFGGVCVTSRGSCQTGRPLPRNAPCGCEVPGFGYKRGAVN